MRYQEKTRMHGKTKVREMRGITGWANKSRKQCLVFTQKWHRKSVTCCETQFFYDTWQFVLDSKKSFYNALFTKKKNFLPFQLPQLRNLKENMCLDSLLWKIKVIWIIKSILIQIWVFDILWRESDSNPKIDSNLKLRFVVFMKSKQF